MIKIIIKENKKLLESEIPYSETVSNKIAERVLKSKNNNKEINFYAEISLREIIFSDKKNRNILNGSPFLWYGNFKGYEFSLIKELKNNWNQYKKSFNKSFIDIILNNAILINIITHLEILDENQSKKANISISTKEDGLTKLEIHFYLKNLLDDEDIRLTAEHELQHINQYLNSITVKYGEEIHTVNDVNKMFPIPINYDSTSIVEPIGLGKRKYKSKDSDPITSSIEKNVEYKPYLSNISSVLFNNLLKDDFYKQKIINKDLNAKELAQFLIRDVLLKNRFLFIKYLGNKRDLINISEYFKKTKEKMYKDDLIRSFIKKINKSRI